MNEEGTVRIYVMGKEYRVPAGLTIMKAMEYAGYRFIRGCGCRGGFCGACGTLYRKEGDYKLYTALACQTIVEDGMYLVQLPFVPAPKARYEIEKLKPLGEVVLSLYPEVARCVGCNTCTKTCPQDIEVMEFIQAVKRGDLERAAELSFDCIQCGLCAARCPAEIKHYHVAQLVRRLYGKYLAKHSGPLKKRLEEIERGMYEKEIEELMKMDKEKLRELYYSREIKV
ncbi:MAG: hypothetical protein PWR13_908 [Archaeoglobi archaeon]|nr:4Fe-4S dicluster domain-containing protein [Candidatus Mnemosynella bozhongmuii]MDK2781880.1 hypothetical protein [Archaeoglobi archaeon]